MLNFIRLQIQGGHNAESISSMLISQGWTTDDVNEGIVAAKSLQPKEQIITVEYARAEINNFIHRVYAWMTGGLAITGAIAYLVSNNDNLTQLILGNLFIFFGLLIAELVCVVYLARAVQSMNSIQAAVIFLLYAALNGLTISVIFLVYTISSIGSVFIITAGTFGLTSLYGFFTKKDLTTVGNFAVMALIGIVLASVVNLFFYNDTTSLIISYIAVLVFVLLTAWDTQKIKNLNAIVKIGTEIERKESIVGALTLYLDFINLFLNLLRIMGRRR